MKYFPFIILLYYCRNIETEINTVWQDSRQVISEKSKYFNTAGDGESVEDIPKYSHHSYDAEDAKTARSKVKILNRAKTIEHRLNHGRDIPLDEFSNDPRLSKEYYHIDAVLNHIRRRALKQARRQASDSDSSSSSGGMTDWKDEFNDFWTQKKFEAINSTYLHGDQVNMVAARPWGVSCGDPNQHDMPWGTCMMSTDCDAEYRIYRGDLFCGSTRFVCCALQIENYDMNQGFDVSFASTDLQTGSEEKNNKGKKKKKSSVNKKKRQKDRKKRKRQIKKKIKQIVKEIRNLLNMNLRNTSNIHRSRVNILKKYIKRLKKQYTQDRKIVREYHFKESEKIDKELEKKLEEVRKLNINFLMNATFRDIIINGTINKKGARMLAEAYPELTPYLSGRLRRGGGGEVSEKDADDYLDYDVEYGAVYY